MYKTCETGQEILNDLNNPRLVEAIEVMMNNAYQEGQLNAYKHVLNKGADDE